MLQIQFSYNYQIFNQNLLYLNTQENKNLEILLVNCFIRGQYSHFYLFFQINIFNLLLSYSNSFGIERIKFNFFLPVSQRIQVPNQFQSKKQTKMMGDIEFMHHRNIPRKVTRFLQMMNTITSSHHLFLLAGK